MEIVKKKISIDILNPFISSPTRKKVIHTQTNLQQKPTIFLSAFDYPVWLALKGFTANFC